MNIRKILIVDDSSTSRMIIKRCMEIAGFHEVEYREAQDGLDALEYLQDNKVDLIVTDIKMPKIDGVTLIKKIKINPDLKDIPIVVVSSIGEKALDVEIRSSGADYVIQKPLSPGKVTEVLGDLIHV